MPISIELQRLSMLRTAKHLEKLVHTKNPSTFMYMVKDILVASRASRMEMIWASHDDRKDLKSNKMQGTVSLVEGLCGTL